VTRLLPAFLWPYRRRLLVVVVLVAAQAMANLYLPSLNADIINNGVVKSDTPYILRTGGWMLLVTALMVACSVGAVYAGSLTAMAVGRDLRAAIFRRSIGFSQDGAGDFGTSSLITRNTNDVQQVQMFLVMG